MKYQTIIAGAGPAGLLAGAMLKNGPALILEKKELPGRKLMISGTGQCNFTHAGNINEFKNHFGEGYNFLKHAFKSFSNHDSIRFFRERGVSSITEDNGKVFPSSRKASDILEALVNSCDAKIIQIKTGHSIKSITKENEVFKIVTDSSIFFAENLIIATGGKSYPSTGSTGDGYLFAQSLGHTVTDPNPALAPVIIENYSFQELAGVSVKDAEVILKERYGTTRTYKGDILFTHQGLSGPGILNFSRYLRAGQTLQVNFAGLSENELEKLFTNNAGIQGKQSISTFARTLNIPRSLINAIIQLSIGSATRPLAEISRQQRKHFINLCCAFPFKIEKVGGFKNAMVTAGGINRDEINPLTMESKLVPGLYFCGEVIDIDGDTGGYNIQAAFSTAHLAAMSINKKAT